MRGTVLDEIVAWNRGELERRRERVPLAELEAIAARQAAPRDFAGALRGDALTPTLSQARGAHDEGRPSLAPSP